MSAQPSLVASQAPDAALAALEALDDPSLQQELLQEVSRTFALTIPQLPPPLRRTVSNAYLLCRTVDTIEDEPHLAAADKRAWCERFHGVVSGQEAVEPFAEKLGAVLSAATPAAEQRLVALAPRVVAITRALEPAERRAIERCLDIMATGMAEFQNRDDRLGLPDMAALDRYCYVVAGVVGEMLTELFAVHDPAVAARREPLLALAVRFGQGLQMTNILKDVWDDLPRGECWLPRSVFKAAGVDLHRLDPDQPQPALVAPLNELLAVAHGHLAAALEYTLLIPARQQGIRNFCLWALGMALLTLRRIATQPDYRSGQQVKISRRSVRMTAAACRATAGSDTALRLLFALLARGLPPAADTPSIEHLGTTH
ncbi:MAG TPA: phytoene/squalene synthase family protein [Pseudohaliea sp.]|nr:phytoene/squalene synthase family protein [Pseudohaliea sp.]